MCVGVGMGVGMCVACVACVCAGGKGGVVAGRERVIGSGSCILGGGGGVEGEEGGACVTPSSSLSRSQS